MIPFFCSLSKKKILKVPNAYPRPQDWTQILERVFHHFQSPKLQRAFFQGFSAASSASVETPSMVGACQETLEGLKIALTNLASARTYFETLSKDTSLQEIVPQSVYFKITESGVGTEVKGVDRVRLGYIVEDGQGKVLFANYDQWLKLSETIPSFAHGVQGMRIGEKRTLFIHPAFGYGVMTTLPPCSELVIKVHLMAADECVALKLPPLEPLDLSWIQNPEFYAVIEESIERYPRFVGRFYREMLDKLCPEVDKMSIYQRLSLENDKP